jgi:hypothetical protein
VRGENGIAVSVVSSSVPSEELRFCHGSRG